MLEVPAARLDTAADVVARWTEMTWQHVSVDVDKNLLDRSLALLFTSMSFLITWPTCLHLNSRRPVFQTKLLVSYVNAFFL